MAQHVLEKLAATHPDCEVWWDSSALVCPMWKTAVLDGAPDEKRAEWDAQLMRLFDRRDVRERGVMGFGGATTNPPLSLGNAGDLKAQADLRGSTLTPDEIIDGEMAIMKRGYHHGKQTGHPPKMLQRSMQVVDAGPGAGVHSRHIADLAATANEFAAATRKTVDFVACALAGARSQAA